MTTRIVRALCLGFLVLVGGCVESDRTISVPSSLDAELRQTLQQWGVVPIGRPPSQDSARVALGQALFFDKLLSGNRDIACATCHNTPTSMGDGQSLAVGTAGLESVRCGSLVQGASSCPAMRRRS
jgi:cytochrome c peroxidase